MAKKPAVSQVSVYYQDKASDWCTVWYYKILMNNALEWIYYM